MQRKCFAVPREIFVSSGGRGHSFVLLRSLPPPTSPFLFYSVFRVLFSLDFSLISWGLVAYFGLDSTFLVLVCGILGYMSSVLFGYIFLWVILHFT